MDKTELFNLMMGLPDRIASLRMAMQESVDLLHAAQRELKEVEAHYLLMEDGPVNGKNEQIRAAQLFEKTHPERLRIEELERVVAHREIALETAENSFHAVLAATRISANGA